MRKLGPLRSRPIRTQNIPARQVDGQRHDHSVEGEGQQAVHRPDPTQGPGVEGDVGGLGGDADDDAEVQEIPVVRLAALRELQAAADRRGRLGLRGGIVFVGVVDGEDQLATNQEAESVAKARPTRRPLGQAMVALGQGELPGPPPRRWRRRRSGPGPRSCPAHRPEARRAGGCRDRPRPICRSGSLRCTRSSRRPSSGCPSNWAPTHSE